MMPRRKARSLALQALYELDTTRHSAEEVLARLVYDETVDEQTYDFVSALVYGVLEHRRQFDSIISRHAPSFPVDTMAVVDRNILRLALYEMLYEVDTPERVSINEAIEMAKEYGADSSPRLVNGILGAASGSRTTDTEST
ncbi:MAG: transcription antitermination factor NusB [Chloroflexota bacterium]